MKKTLFILTMIAITFASCKKKVETSPAKLVFNGDVYSYMVDYSYQNENGDILNDSKLLTGQGQEIRFVAEKSFIPEVDVYNRLQHNKLTVIYYFDNVEIKRWYFY